MTGAPSQRARMVELIDMIISTYHTTRLSDVSAADHIIHRLGDRLTSAIEAAAWNTRSTPIAGDEVIERVARALFDHEWANVAQHHRPDFGGDDREYWLASARAAIEAIGAPVEQEEIERLRGVVKQCRDRFREYEANHLAKVPYFLAEPFGKEHAAAQDATTKAARNREMADLCESALHQRPPHDR